jgi:hypothetical protein
MAYNCPHCKEAIPDAISKGELTSKIEKHNTLTGALEKRIEEMEKAARSADRTHNAALQALREELTNSHTAALQMARLGLDEDAAAVAELLHGRLPAEGRPALTDWLQAQRDDPATAHPLLRSYFGDKPAATATPAAEPPKTAPPAGAALPAPTGRQVNGTPPQYTPEMINNMSDAEFMANIGTLSNVAGFDVAAALGLSVSRS